MAPVPETWQMYTEGRPQQLSELEQGWASDEPDGTIGNPIHPWCLRMAKTLAYAIMSEHGVRVYLMGCLDGGLSLEWCENNNDHMITIDPPAAIATWLCPLTSR